MKNKPIKNMNKAITYILLTIFAIISLLPLYWVFSTSLQLSSYQSQDMERPVSYVNANPPKMYPMGIPLYFEHWSEAREAEKAGDAQLETYHRDMMDYIIEDTFASFVSLFTKQDVGKWFFNSIYIAVIVTVGILLFDSMAGYVLAKKRFPGRNLIFWIIISTMMIPGQVTLVPLFIMVGKLDLMDTHWAMILPDLAMVFGVFLMRQFMYSIPDELLEAAKMDGASEWKTFWTVVLPLAKPGLAALGIFTFMSVWNSFLWPIIVLNSADLYTLPVGLKTLQDANLASFKLLMSGAAITAIPMIIVFVLFQRHFVKGLTIGGVKE